MCAIAVAVSSAPSEIHIQPKRVKTGIHSSMGQVRFKGLLYVVVKRKILHSLNKGRTVDLLAKLSPQLSAALM